MASVSVNFNGVPVRSFMGVHHNPTISDALESLAGQRIHILGNLLLNKFLFDVTSRVSLYLEE